MRPSKISGLSAPPDPNLEPKLWVEARINAGMITTLESANIPNSAFQLAKNTIVRYDQTSRRAGSFLFSPAAPDSNAVLKTVFFKTKVGVKYLLRITRSTIRLLDSGAWVPLTISPALTGTNFDYITTADILSTLVMANNGVNVLQKINPTTLQVAPLGNAPAYRYVTGFFNRAVGAALAGVDETQVGWSADGVVDEWNPATNQTAGSAPLVESPSDLSDPLRGIFGFSNVMIVAREKSIWLTNKQPIPTNPFYFYPVIPSIGTDCPFSLQLTKNALIWLDTRTQSVWAYTPGMAEPERIGAAIENKICRNINDTLGIFSCYSPVFDEYTVYIPSIGSDVIKGWTFNFRTKAWTYNEYIGISSADDVEIQASNLAIEDLVGSIQDLVGSIENLGPTNVSVRRIYGKTNGEIAIEDQTLDLDAGNTEFETEIVSKSFRLPELDQYVAKVVIEYQCTRAGEFTLEYSKSGGSKKDDWIVAKIVNPIIVGKPVNLILRRMIKTRRFAWRLRSKLGQYELLSYEIHTYPSGQSRGS